MGFKKEMLVNFASYFEKHHRIYLQILGRSSFALMAVGRSRVKRTEECLEECIIKDAARTWTSARTRQFRSDFSVWEWLKRTDSPIC